jgi:hypothetical protein
MPHRAEREPTLALTCLGLFLALWPVVIVHLAYAVSILQDTAPACNPYWDGCTSISHAGRYGGANYLFRGALMPYTALLAGAWWINQRWLQSLGDAGSRPMLSFGCLGALFMVLYLTFLGSEGTSYQLMRRYGINVYFGGTYVAQVLLLRRLLAVSRARPAALPGWLVPGASLAALGVFASGAAFLVVKYALARDTGRLEDALEWVVALLMQAFLLVTVLGWSKAGLRLRVDASGAASRTTPAPRASRT